MAQMNSNFPNVLQRIELLEGGFVNNPRDPGGATNEGVTQHQYDLWRIAHKQPTRSVKFLDPNEAEAIYRSWYWNVICGDQLPAGVDYCVMDGAVNSGPHQAVKWLQRAAGVVDDGFIGPKTLVAVNEDNPVQLISAICDERLAFDRSLKTWPYFGRGWAARIAEVEGDAQGMV
jgi:lysozyme family protein